MVAKVRNVRLENADAGAVRVRFDYEVLFGWDLPAIMVLFWAESAVIAFYTILKMILDGKLFARQPA